MKTIAMTIVLNGMPYIKHQIDIIPSVFDEWHIIEGATIPYKDTSWCKQIDDKFYSDNFLSIDGTSQIIDEAANKYKNIFVYRKGDLYNGKTEMCNEIMHSMKDCVLMQIDVDELWDKNTLEQVLQYAKTEDIQGMLFKCNYFVGPRLVISNEGCYGNYDTEWRRLWKIKERTYWESHEPPQIHGLTNYVSREFTKSRGWIFNHYAYALQQQLQFKENFYGYTNAVNQWKNLQQNQTWPCLLKHYFSWVKDNAVVVKLQDDMI